MNQTLLKAAVIGLGKAGSQFDEEPRTSVWSHTGAFLALAGDYRIVGGADPLEEARKKFSHRCPEALVLADGVAMVSQTMPDVVSISTPPSGRAQLVERLVEVHRPGVIICEKALEIDAVARQRLVDICAAADIHLLVHYNRRYQEIYRLAREAIVAGRLGKLTSITVTAPNRLWSIGSHAINILFYLAGETLEAWSALSLPMLEETGEPAVDFTCRFPSGFSGHLSVAGFRNMLVFEVDIIGEAGRLRILDNGERAVLVPFVESPIYIGYKEQGKEQVFHVTDARDSSFVGIASEAASLVRGATLKPRCSAHDAVESESLLDSLYTVSQTPGAVGVGHLTS